MIDQMCLLTEEEDARYSYYKNRTWQGQEGFEKRLGAKPLEQYEQRHLG
jgi:hypothetical protein